MKKILFIATSDIGKRTGGGLACLAYYNAFKRLYPGSVDLAMAEECCVGKYSNSIKITSRGTASKCLGLLRGELHRYKAFFKKFIPKVSNLYSFCVINGGIYAGDMIDIFHEYGIKTIVIHHNFEREYNLDNKTIASLYGFTSYFVIRNERNAYLNCDANCFLTESDLKLFHDHYGISQAKEILLGVFESTPQALPSLNQLYTGHDKIVITGSMNSFQTIDGIMDFKENYFYLLKQIWPGSSIIIAGRNPSDKIVQFYHDHHSSVELVSNPPIMEDIIRNGPVFLCPTRVGGGLKWRIMDGLRMGLPVITHKVSSRGYDAFFDYPFFQIYDDKETFVTAVDNILHFLNNNIDYHQSIRNIYSASFSFESGCMRLKSLMDQFDIC